MSESKNFVYCLVCDKQLEIFEEDVLHSSRYFIPCVGDGIVCESHGNYGSSLFDPIHDNENLQFYICDECVKVKSDKIRWFKTSRIQEIQIIESKMLSDVSSEYKNSQEEYLTLKEKHLEVKKHLWYPVPAPGRFRCTICEIYVDITNRNISQIWDSICPGKVVKEEVDSTYNFMK